jgi:hypothetical protein
MRFGRARNIEVHLAKHLVVVINERHIDFNRFADTGIREMVGHVFAVLFVRQPLADLGQIVLAIGIVDVG